MKNTGLVYIFTGDGKGKTSAALGTLLRGLGNGWRVGWVSLYKEEQWKLSELQFVALLQSEAQQRLDMRLRGKGFYLKDQPKKSSVKIAKVNDAVVVDDDDPQIHQQAAHKALTEVEEMLQSGSYDVVIIDEICNAIFDGLVSENSVIKILSHRQQTHIVLTGRNASKSLIKHADLVSEVRKIKHPFDSGQNAIKGLDF